MGVETRQNRSHPMRRQKPEQRAFARHLRTNLTDAERCFWRGLRTMPLGHFTPLGHGRFRRQHPIGPYFLDFACIAAKLAIELDGGQHAGSATDAVRDTWLASQGWRVLRFWNHEVLANLEGVMVVIADAIVRPPPQPSPCPGEGVQASPCAAKALSQ